MNDETLVYLQQPTHNPRVFTNPVNSDQLYSEDTLEALGQLLQAILLANSHASSPEPDVKPTKSNDPTPCVAEWIILDSIGYAEFMLTLSFLRGKQTTLPQCVSSNSYINV